MVPVSQTVPRWSQYDAWRKTNTLTISGATWTLKVCSVFSSRAQSFTATRVADGVGRLKTSWQ
ncbi:unnamed protein product, partial [Ectocarpus sp. 8 AP-2014]